MNGNVLGGNVFRGVHEWVQTGSQRLRRSRSRLVWGRRSLGCRQRSSSGILLRTGRPPNRHGKSSTRSHTRLIIEQTRELFEDPELWGADPEKSALTVHHYLSETVVHHDDYDAGDTAATDDEETASMLGEAWRDGTVLTTFVQLFESLAGPTNRQGLKLPSLESSIIILDEPQALPKDWWGAIQRLLDIVTDEYGARVIAMMTATQPTLVRDRETDSLLAAGSAHNSKVATGATQPQTTRQHSRQFRNISTSPKLNGCGIP